MSRSTDKTIFVAGHRGMVGSALLRRLRAMGDCQLLTASREELNLLDQRSVMSFFQNNHIDQVYLAAARVGGIMANNTQPAEFIYENLMIEANVIHSAHSTGVQQLLFLGSSCIYPREAECPIREEALMSGPLEPTNEAYAAAKIAGIKLCESYNRQYGRDYRSVMPTNLYGPNDNFHPQNSHVVPALIRRFHEAVERGDDEVVIWGTGTPLREFLHVDDMASASVHVMELDDKTYRAFTQPRLSHINVGTGEELSIRTLAETVAKVTGFTGTLSFDSSKPDGTPRKLLDMSRIRSLGWQATYGLERGLTETYNWYLQNVEQSRSHHASEPA
jgi:GDP-L-fucose synthase